MIMRKTSVISQKIKLENYKPCLEENQLENKIKFKNKLDANSPREYHQEFRKKLISKSQQKLRSKKHNIFTEEVNKIALSDNDEKQIQLIDSIETYSYGTSKDIVCRKKN